ncbi:protocatechuate 3,4-dioxygenase [Luteolibacter sp. SL250]|uniref:protocatechuate 3,4-dioxygenase n=1 Tax=Luteolibacter sp. SL250 TaxID=2995170 RepID=UPI00226E7361|nr:protocatechuate 3,4-dioxygenase [Luteolibacter sp. SL250]WAC20042.1 protocatechuate 3,4-dioxygenase [Luteolibacter sp. SL250]
MNHRRHFMRNFVAGAAGLWIPGAFAEALTLTPRQTEGPFYPTDLPLDTDNDLIIINDSTNPSLGEITHLSGRVLDENGAPIRNAVVEIWQTDQNGVYLHKGSDGTEKRDGNFQGFGRFLTGSAGEYYFRTIKPVKYPGRVPHIHFAVKMKGREKWTTQLYVKGDPANEKDFVIRNIKDAAQRESVIREFKPIPGSKAGELAVTFDIVMGFTPQDG